ncbi:hypothetical protein OXX59_005164 [Metschnikowia pulcherrima]
MSLVPRDTDGKDPLLLTTLEEPKLEIEISVMVTFRRTEDALRYFRVNFLNPQDRLGCKRWLEVRTKGRDAM